MAEVEAGAAVAAPEGNAIASTPTQVQVVEAPKKSVEDTMSEVFDKMNPPRDERQRFVAKEKPEETSAEDPAVETQEAAPAQNQEGQAQEQVSEPSPVIAAPNSLPAELREEWSKVPPKIADWSAKREAEQHKRITELGATAKASEQLRTAIDRFRPSFKGVDPIQAIEKLVAANDFLEQKPEDGLRWLADAYGVDLSKLASGQPSTDGNAEIASLRQTISQLQRQIAETSTRVQSREQREAETHQQSIAKLVEDFAKDKPHWSDIENDTLEQIHAVRATNPNLPPQDILQKAYDRALKLNEAVQAKLAAEKQKAADEAKKAEEAKKAAAAKKAASINVGRGATATSKAKGSWEETMREVGERAYG